MDFYKCLNVNENATQDEIKKAFRKLSLKHHPDKGGSRNKFNEINDAYQTLGDANKRKQYDMTRKGIPFGIPGGGMPGGIQEDVLNMLFKGMSGGMSQGMNGMPFMFSQTQTSSSSNSPNVRIFRNGIPVNVNMQQAMKKPAPIVDTIHITLEQAYNGYKYPYEVERYIQENNTKQIEKETVYIDIPKGIDDNEIVMLRGKGNQLNENNKGDIKLFVKIKNNTEFIRKGLNLIYKKQITLKEALCGFDFSIDFFNDRKFKITNFETIIKPNFTKSIQGLGMSRDSHTGDLHIVFDLIFPENLGREIKDKLKDLL
jgi:DnaJ family protein A protein 2